MDYISVGLAFLAGLIVGYILFKKVAFLGKFEAMIWEGLAQNKQVIVSIDSDAFIFERYGDKVRVTSGIVDLMMEEPHGSDVENSDTDKLVNDIKDVLSSVEKK